MDYRPIGFGGGGNSRNTPSYATEMGISANLMGHLTHMQTSLPLHTNGFAQRLVLPKRQKSTIHP